MKIALICLLFLLPIGLYAQSLKSEHNTSTLGEQTYFEHVLWDGIPISIALPVGSERIIKFDQRVSIKAINHDVSTSDVSMISNNGFVYIKAKHAFGPARIEATLASGEVILVDLTAKAQAPDTPVNIVMKETSPQADNSNPKESQYINIITLTRFAIQHLYAPERLIVPNRAIHRTPMFTSKSVALFADKSVMAMPLVSWRAGNLYVTAVLLKNPLKQEVDLDPRIIAGHWICASFYPSNHLGKAGSVNDRTTVFLTSHAPFNDALNSVKGYDDGH